MKRLSMLMKNKTERIGNAKHFVVLPDRNEDVDSKSSKIDKNSLEPSGLTDFEIDHLERWVEGRESGRNCMLAILDSKYKERLLSAESESFSSLKDSFGKVDDKENNGLSTGEKHKQEQEEVV